MGLVGPLGWRRDVRSVTPRFAIERWRSDPSVTPFEGVKVVLTRICPVCGRSFAQPDDPGRKRVYDTDACKQSAYRARTGRTGHEARAQATERPPTPEDRAQREARQAEQASRVTEARRAKYAQERQRRSDAAKAAWARRQEREAHTAKQQDKFLKLKIKATHRNTTDVEAAALHEKAEQLREKYGLPKPKRRVRPKPPADEGRRSSRQATGAEIAEKHCE
jgi:hypothetical protein